MKTIYADNDKEMLKRVTEFLRSYCEKRNEPFEIELYTDPYKLIEMVQKNVYDFMILNSVFPDQKESGLEISVKTRKFVPYIPTIFIQKSAGENAEINFVYPRRFELNPFTKESFCSTMDDIYLRIFSASIGSINVVTIDKKMIQIKVSEIVYVESTKKIISIYLYGGRCIQINGPMKKFAEVLSGFMEFMFPHQSFAVNSTFVSKIANDKIYLKNCNVEIPIAKGKLQSIKLTYKRYLKTVT